MNYFVDENWINVIVEENIIKQVENIKVIKKKLYLLQTYNLSWNLAYNMKKKNISGS